MQTLQLYTRIFRSWTDVLFQVLEDGETACFQKVITDLSAHLYTDQVRIPEELHTIFFVLFFKKMK